MIEERFESYVYQIMQYVKYQENKPYIEDILEEMRYTLFREDRNYIKQLEKDKKKAIDYIKDNACYDEDSKRCNDDLSYKECDELLEILGDGNNE